MRRRHAAVLWVGVVAGSCCKSETCSTARTCRAGSTSIRPRTRGPCRTAARSAPDKPIGVLRTDRQYENFILTLEWKHLTAGGNSGVFLWSEGTVPEGKRLPTGMEVQILELDWAVQHKRPTPTSTARSSRYGRNHDRAGQSPRPPQQVGREPLQGQRPVESSTRSSAVDGVIKLSVNGKFVNGIRDASIKKGYICLESEGAPIHFRNIKIIELPPGITPPEKAAPVVQDKPEKEAEIMNDPFESSESGPPRFPGRRRRNRRPAGHAMARTSAGQTPAAADSEEQKRIEAALPGQGIRHARANPGGCLIFDLNVGLRRPRFHPHREPGLHSDGRQDRGVRDGRSAKTRPCSSPRASSSSTPSSSTTPWAICFEDPALRQSLVEFVYGGGGLMGVHGTSVAFTKWPGAIEDWPEFGIMLGARGANHKANDEHVFIKLDDPAHPINQAFGGQDFDYRDEFFRVHEPYSRDRVRVLLSIDTAKTDMTADRRPTGQGRAGRQRLRAGLGPPVRPGPRLLLRHRPPPLRLLGPQDAPVLPGGHAVRPGRPAGPDDAEREADPGDPGPGETRLATGARAVCAAESTLFETIDKAATIGSALRRGFHAVRRSAATFPKTFDEQLSGDEMRQIRLKLDAAGVRLLMYRTSKRGPMRPANSPAEWAWTSPR